MVRNISKTLYWSPRILSLFFLLLLAMSSLDVFEAGLSFRQTLLALFMHNIIVFILAILLYLAWKKPIIGAYTFLGSGISYLSFVTYTIIKDGFEWYYMAWILQISGISFLVCFLWWKNHKK